MEYHVECQSAGVGFRVTYVKRMRIHATATRLALEEETITDLLSHVVLTGRTDREITRLGCDGELERSVR